MAASASPGGHSPPGLVRAVDRASALVAMAFVVALTTVVLLGVVSRAVGEPFIWTDEVSRFLMVWLACFGWMLASRRRSHIRVRYFQDLLPPVWWRGGEAVMQGAVALLGALIAWFGVGLVIRNHDLEATTVPISMAWMYAPMVLAGLVTALQGLAEIHAALRGSRTLSPNGVEAPIE